MNTSTMYGPMNFYQHFGSAETFPVLIIIAFVLLGFVIFKLWTAHDQEDEKNSEKKS